MEKKGKILIVDDNEDVLLSLNMLLKPYVEGIRVITTPERIIGMMDSFMPDVIMLDMNFHRDAISGEEGYEWLEKILAHNPKSVVLFITAYVDTEKAVRAIKAGAIDFIPKPWDRNKLLDTVKSAVELSRERNLNSSDLHEKESELNLNLNLNQGTDWRMLCHEGTESADDACGGYGCQRIDYWREWYGKGCGGTCLASAFGQG